MKPENCFPISCDRANISSSMTMEASAGMTPTMERTLTGTAAPFGVTSRS